MPFSLPASLPSLCRHYAAAAEYFEKNAHVLRLAASFSVSANIHPALRTRVGRKGSRWFRDFEAAGVSQTAVGRRSDSFPCTTCSLSHLITLYWEIKTSSAKASVPHRCPQRRVLMSAPAAAVLSDGTRAPGDRLSNQDVMGRVRDDPLSNMDGRLDQASAKPRRCYQKRIL